VLFHAPMHSVVVILVEPEVPSNELLIPGEFSLHTPKWPLPKSTDVARPVAPSLSLLGPNFAKSDNALVLDANDGLAKHVPELCEDGVNGSYIMKNENGIPIAIFKPNDEQGDATNNPKKEDSPIRNGVPSECGQREVAAHLLDRTGYYGVPHTVMVELRKKDRVQVGSLQAYITNDGPSCDFGSSMFPVDEVHKIGILDLHMFNIDRNDGNILVRKTPKGCQLYPIDHGFSLPDYRKLSDACESIRYDWMSWPQAQEPFSAESLAHIASIDIEADIEMLRQRLQLSEECLMSMRISATLLKKGAAAGLTLYQIASILCRADGESSKSTLERICEEAFAATSQAGNDNTCFFEFFCKLLDEEVSKLLAISTQPCA